MRSDTRQVFAKVEISYNDPTVDTSLTLSASETGRFTYTAQLADEINAPDYKYFSLHNNKLDGTFHPLPGTTSEAECGWWGSHLSSNSGNLDPSKSKNLLPHFADWAIHANAAIDATNDYKLTLTTTTSGYKDSTVTVPALPNTTYTISFTGNGSVAVNKDNLFGTRFLNKDGNFTGSATFTTDSTTTLLYIDFFNGAGAVGTFTFINPQLEVSSVATTFDQKVTTPAPVITMTFIARPVYTLKVTGDNILNEYPVDFVIKLYNAADTVVYTETVTGNTLVSWEKDIADVGSIVKMTLTISKINKANTVPKILECYTGVSETYDSETLIDLTLLEEQVYDDMTLPIGNVSSNEIDIRLDNIDRHFDPRNTDSPLYGQMKKNRRVKPYLGADLNGDGTITWYPLGVFFTTEWKAPTNDISAEVTARDRLETLKQRDFTVSEVYENYSLYDIAEIVFLDAGLLTREFYIDPALSSVTVPYMWFDRVSHREALSQIAEAGLARLYCDRTGKLILEAQRTTDAALFEFKDDETIFSSDYPFAAGQFVNYVETKVNSRSINPTPETIYQSSDTLTVSGSTTQAYTFNFVPCVNVQPPIVVSSGVTVASYTVYAWGVVVSYIGSGTVTSVSIDGQKLEISGGSVAVAQDTTSINENGKVTKSISHDFIQTLDRAQSISDSILDAYKDPRNDIEMDTRGHVSLQLGDKITAPGFDLGTTDDYYIVRQETRWDGALSAKIKGLKV
jgi:hypothetical protein